MVGTPASDIQVTDGSFDYSTPEAVAALKGVSDLMIDVRSEMETGALKGVSSLILELREEMGVAGASEPVMRKVRLYERTLGLAVIPVLLRRGLYAVYYRVRGGQASQL